MPKILDIYLIAAGNKRFPFIPSDLVETFAAQSPGDRVRRSIAWFERRRNRVLAWVGRTLKTGYDYYLRLEDRIDPVERVLKTIAHAGRLVVCYGPPDDAVRAREELYGILRRQQRKHIFWFVVDMIISGVVIMFTPFLAPIPGPNVFFYYPFLRLLSHYRALRGCAAGLHSSEIHFKCLPEMSGLEENLRAPQVDRRTVREWAAGLNIRGLEQFLERMV